MTMITKELIVSTGATYAVLGTGNIGGELMAQLAQGDVAERMGLRQEPSLVLNRRGLHRIVAGEAELLCPTLDDLPTDELPVVAFNALPSADDDTSCRAMERLLKAGTLVVTAEKTALAYNFGNFEKLSDGFERMGVNAAIGGGTRPLEVAEPFFRDTQNITQVHGAFNGTLTEIYSSVASSSDRDGLTPGQAVQRAVDLGYAEPDAESTHDVIRQEAEGDYPKKLSIFMNWMKLGGLIHPDELGFSLTDDDIQQSLEEANFRRFFASIYNTAHSKNMSIPEGDIVGAKITEHDEWVVVTGFRNINRNPLFAKLARLSGPGNGLVVGLGPDERDGAPLVASGEGAGRRPTVNTMLDDWLKIREATTR